MPVGELIACLICIFALSFATVICFKLSIRFQDHMRIVKFIMFGVWMVFANQFGQSMLCLAGAVRAQPQAEAQIGLNYLTGKLPCFGHSYNLFWPQNTERGRYWLDKATESGNDGAEAVLAAAYLDGKSGLPRDPMSAAKHLAHIADSSKGDKTLKADSAYALADLYDKGDGIPQNPALTIKYLMVAADAGNAAAAMQLAEGCEKGKWGDPDYGRAYVYYKKAAENGDPNGWTGYNRLKEMLGQK